MIKYLHTSASAIRTGLPVQYEVKINDKWVLTGGTVQAAVKTAENEITVTVKHWKTGETFTNTLKAHWAIRLHMVALVNANHVGTLTLWPTKDNLAVMQLRTYNWTIAFASAAVGTEF
jgi:hypothetical protein